jgi:hypothetical protein
LMRNRRFLFPYPTSVCFSSHRGSDFHEKARRVQRPDERRSWHDLGFCRVKGRPSYMCISWTPLRMIPAQRKSLKPCIGRVMRLTARWSCSTMWLRLRLWRGATERPKADSVNGPCRGRKSVYSRISASICERPSAVSPRTGSPAILGSLSDSVTVRSTYASSAGKQHSCGDRAAGVPGRPRRCGCTIGFSASAVRAQSAWAISLSAEDEPTEDELESVDCDADADRSNSLLPDQPRQPHAARGCAAGARDRDLRAGTTLYTSSGSTMARCRIDPSAGHSPPDQEAVQRRATHPVRAVRDKSPANHSSAKSCAISTRETLHHRHRD